MRNSHTNANPTDGHGGVLLTPASTFGALGSLTTTATTTLITTLSGSGDESLHNVSPSDRTVVLPQTTPLTTTSSGGPRSETKTIHTTDVNTATDISSSRIIACVPTRRLHE